MQTANTARLVRRSRSEESVKLTTSNLYERKGPKVVNSSTIFTPAAKFTKSEEKAFFNTVSSFYLQNWDHTNEFWILPFLKP